MARRANPHLSHKSALEKILKTWRCGACAATFETKHEDDFCRIFNEKDRLKVAQIYRNEQDRLKEILNREKRFKK